MRCVLEIAFTGLTTLFLHPLRTAVSFAALLVLLVPYLVGLALARGLEADAEAAARAGADLYVSGRQFGWRAPVPLKVVSAIRRIEGVTEVWPRVLGEVVLGKDHISAILVGMPPESLPSWSEYLDGSLPRPGRLNELVLGSVLAQRLGLKIGDSLLPFYSNHHGDHLSRVVGIFKKEAPYWHANLILTTLDAASYIFDQEGMATELLVWCQPGSQSLVSRAIERSLSLQDTPGEEGIKARVTSREELGAVWPRGPRQRAGVFNLLFIPAFAVGILALLVTSGVGLPERSREIGILKATGWQTDEVLLRSLAESVALSVLAASTAVLLAWLWLHVGNGYAIANLFLDSPDATGVPLPFQMTPVPALLGFGLALVITLSGTLYSSWRAAITPPRQAMH